MKNRDYKLFRAHCYYHIFNRGNNKQPIFLDDDDYIQFLKRLELVMGTIPAKRPFTSIRSLPKDSFSIVAYCLMNNHFHFLIRQNADVGINKLIQKVCTSYAVFFNKKYQRVGGLFQDQFKAKLIDNDVYAQYVSAYIHNNPNDLDYPYSSYKDIIGERKSRLIDRNIILSWFDDSVMTYVEFVKKFTLSDKVDKQQLLYL